MVFESGNNTAKKKKSQVLGDVTVTEKFNPYLEQYVGNLIDGIIKNPDKVLKESIAKASTSETEEKEPGLLEKVYIGSAKKKQAAGESLNVPEITTMAKYGIEVDEVKKPKNISQAINYKRESDYKNLEKFEKAVRQSKDFYSVLSEEKTKTKGKKNLLEKFIDDYDTDQSDEKSKGDSTVLNGDGIFKYLLSNEKQIYRYLVNKGDAKKAREYINAKKPTLETRKAEDVASDRKGISGVIKNTGDAFATGVQTGLVNMARMGVAGNIAAGKNTGVLNELLQPTYPEKLYNEIREQHGNKNKIYGIVLDVANNIGVQTPQIAFSAAGGTGAYLAAMSQQIIGGDTTEAINNGYDGIRGIIYGAFDTALEYGTEYLLGGIASKINGGETSILVKKTLGAVDKAVSNKKVANALSKIIVTVSGANAEGTEEFLQTLIEPVLRNVIYGENNQYSADTFAEAVNAYIVGAISGGIMSIPYTGSNLTNTKLDITGDFIKKNSSVNAVLSLSEVVGNKSEIYEQIKSENEANRDISNTELAELFYQSAEMFKNPSKEIVESFASKNVDKLTELAKESKLNDTEPTSTDVNTSGAETETELAEAETQGTDAELTETEAGLATDTDINTTESTADTNVADSESVFTERSAQKPEYDMLADGLNYGTDRVRLSEDQLKIASTGRALGHKVIFENIQKTQGVKSDGYIEANGTIHIDYNCKNPTEFVLKHELTHFGEGTEEYKSFAEEVKNSKAYEQWINKEVDGEESTAVKSAKYRKRITDNYAANGKKLTPTQAEAELIANFTGDVLFKADGSGLEAIMSDMSDSRRSKFVNFFKNFISYLKAKLTRNKTITAEVLKLERLFNEALTAAEQNNNTATEGDVKYKLREYSQHQKDNWKSSKKIVVYENNEQFKTFIKSALEDKQSNKKIYFGAVPTQLAILIKSKTGLDVENYNCSLSSYEIRKIFKDHGNNETEILRGQRAVTENDILNIPLVIQSPDDISRSPKDYMGKPVINMSKSLDGKLSIAAVVSDKHLDLFVQTAFVGNKKGNLVTPIAEQAAINTPKASSDTVSGYSISNSAENVKNNISENISETDSEGNKLSQEQQKYFADSKVRSKDGELLVMYHGTKTENGDFYVFDSSKAVKKGGLGLKALGKGNYFTSKKLDGTERFGSRVIEAYLNITNPFVYDGANGDIVSLAQQVEKDTGVSTEGMTADELQNKMRELGYDGVIEYRRDGSLGIAVTFDSEQIKEIGNTSPTSNPDIRYSIPTRQAELLKKYDNGEIAREEYLEESNKNWEEAVNNYGTFKEGENAKEKIPVPKAVREGKNTAQFVKTVIESGHLSSRMIEDMGAEMLEGGFEYTPVTDEQAQTAADKAIKNGEAEAIWKNAVKASRLLNKDSIAVGEKLLMQAIKAKDTQRVVELTAELSDVLVRNGQNVQAASMFKKMTGAGKLVTIQRFVDKLNSDRLKKYGDTTGIVKLDEHIAEQIAESAPGEDISGLYNDALRDIASQTEATFLDKWNAWRYMSMMTNPTTHIRNIVGNAVFTPSVRMKDFTGAVLENMFVEESERTKVIKTQKKYRDFAEKDAARVDVKNALANGGHYSEASISQEISEYQRVFKTRWLEFVRKGNSNLLEAEDAFFKNIHYKHALAGFLQARGTDLNNVTEKTLWEARAYAMDEALKATFNDSNSIATILNNAAKGNKYVDIVINGILPFKKTPVNIVRRGVEYSPIGLLSTLTKGTYDLKKGKISVTEYIDGMGAGISGTAVFAVGMLLASLGVVTGSFGDSDEDDFRKLNGEQEYSLQIGGKSYTIDWSAPACIPFFIGVELMNEMRKEKEDFSVADVSDVMWNSFEPILELSMLSGVQSMIESVKYADNGRDLIALAGNVTKSYFSQGLPTVGGKLARTVDSKRRSNYIDKNSKLSEFSQGVVNTVKAKVPILENTRPEYVDEWGQTESNGNIAKRIFENFFSPGYASSYGYDKLSEELLRISNTDEVKNDSDLKVFPQYAQKSFTVNGETKYLTADEYVKYAEAKGKYSREYIEEFLNGKEYQKLTDEERAYIITELYKYANAKAKTEVSDYDISSIGTYKKPYNWEKGGKPIYRYYVGKALSRTKEEK